MNWNYFFKSGSHLHSLNLKFWTKWLKSVDLTLSSFSWSTTRPFSWFAWVDLKFHWDLSSSESGKASPSVWRLRFIHSFGQTWKLLLKRWKWESPLIGGDLWYPQLKHVPVEKFTISPKCLNTLQWSSFAYSSRSHLSVLCVKLLTVGSVCNSFLDAVRPPHYDLIMHVNCGRRTVTCNWYWHNK